MNLSNHIKSQIDFLLASLSTFVIFIFTKSVFGIDMAGFFGLIISAAAILETIQQGLYERPAYLGLPSGINRFKLSISNIFISSLILSLILDRFFLSGYLIVNSLYITSLVLLQNIRTYDYVNNILDKASKRSVFLAVFKVCFIGLIFFKIIILDFTLIILVLAIINFIVVLFNKTKIFGVNHQGTNQSTKILLTSLLILLKNKLPLWLLIPFGLGLIGIYETFRTLVEIYLIPAKAILKLMLKEINKDNSRYILIQGFKFGTISIIAVFLSFDLLTQFDIYNHSEILNLTSKISLGIIVLFFWLTESISIVLQNKKYLNFEFNRRLFSLVIFLIINLIFFNHMTYKLFVLNVSLIYVFEVMSLLYFYKKYYV